MKTISSYDSVTEDIPTQLCFVVYDSTFLQNLNIKTSTILSQPIPKVKVGYLHRLRSVIYHYVCVPLPPMPPEVPNGNPAVPVCHMAQEQFVMVEFCVLLFM